MNDIDVAPLRETRSFDRRPQLDIHADSDRPHPVRLHSPDPAAEHPQEDVESSEPTTVAGDAAAFSSGRHTPLLIVHTRRSSAKRVALCYRALNEEEPFMRRLGGR
jgi:hypothetical protein